MTPNPHNTLVERLRHHAKSHEWFIAVLAEQCDRLTERDGSELLPERARQSDHAPVMREAADRITSLEADRDALIEALKVAEQFLDKALALAEGEYVGSVKVLARRLAEVRDDTRTTLQGLSK